MTTPIEIIRDYIVSTSYRRAEQDGPNFARWRTNGLVSDPSLLTAEGSNRFIPAINAAFYGSGASSAERRPFRKVQIEGIGLPSAASDLGEHVADLLAGGFVPAPSTHAQRLAQVLKYSATPLRWESLTDPTSQHRGIPSPSSLFPCEIYILARNGKTQAYRYHPHFQILEHLGASDAVAEALNGDDLAFVIIGNLSCCAAYGEFSPCLIALEAGMLQAQLALLCSAVGWQTHTRESAVSPALRQALKLTHWSQLLLLTIAVKKADDEDVLAGSALQSVEISQFDAPVAELDRYPRLRQLVGALELSGVRATVDRARTQAPHRRERTRNVALAERLGDLSVDGLVRQRTSGRFEGLAPFHRQLSAGDLEALFAFAHQLGELDWDNDLHRIDVKAVLSVDHGRDGLSGGFVADLRSGDLAPLPEARNRLHRRLRVSQISHHRSLVITLAADDLTEMERLGPRAFLSVHMAAGIHAQRLCLGAAACGMSARPIRGYSELFVNSALPIDTRAIFQVVCCFERRVNPRFELI